MENFMDFETFVEAVNTRARAVVDFNGSRWPPWTVTCEVNGFYVSTSVINPVDVITTFGKMLSSTYYNGERRVAC
jgi:hypothetical protein